MEIKVLLKNQISTAVCYEPLCQMNIMQMHLLCSSQAPRKKLLKLFATKAILVWFSFYLHAKSI